MILELTKNDDSKRNWKNPCSILTYRLKKKNRYMIFKKIHPVIQNLAILIAEMDLVPMYANFNICKGLTITPEKGLTIKVIDNIQDSELQRENLLKLRDVIARREKQKFWKRRLLQCQ